MKKVLITGASGLLGSTIARKLVAQGVSVRGLKRANSRLDLLGDDAAKIEWVEGDVLDVVSLAEAMEGISHLVHSAAMISFTPKDVPAMMQINIEGTANVMNAALDAGVSRVVHVSSVAAFCRPKGVKLIDENLDIKDSKDNFHYYRSKFLGEREAFRAHAEGLPVVIINPSTILGGGFWNMEPNKLFLQIAKGYSFYTNGTNGFVDVRDVSTVALRLLESTISGEKFIVSAANLSFRELMNKIAEAFGAKKPSIEASKWIGELAWRADALKSLATKTNPFVTKEIVQIAAEKFQYDNSKIIKEIGFKFMDIDKTVRVTANLYLEAKSAHKSYSLPLL